MYLNKEELLTRLKLGKPVEQWIGTVDEDDYVILKWLSVEKDRNDGYCVSYFEVYDDGNEDYLDIYEFSALDPDEPDGLTTSFPTPELALGHCILQYDCSYENFVSGGMIQKEYRKYQAS